MYLVHKKEITERCRHFYTIYFARKYVGNVTTICDFWFIMFYGKVSDDLVKSIFVWKFRK